MLEVAGEEIQTVSMDHHGLVAAVCKDLKIAERVDKRLGVNEQRVVSGRCQHGCRVKKNRFALQVS